MSVVAVMGTTEESSIDPLTDILKIRKDFSKKVKIDGHGKREGCSGSYSGSLGLAREKSHLDTAPLGSEISKQIPQYSSRNSTSKTTPTHKAGKAKLNTNFLKIRLSLTKT